MYMWKGAFAPFTKHHGGDAVDHIDIGSDWDYDNGTLTVTFSLETNYKENQKYTVEIDVDESEAEDLDDEEVKELIAEQLALPKDQRTWHPVSN